METSLAALFVNLPPVASKGEGVRNINIIVFIYFNVHRYSWEITRLLIWCGFPRYFQSAFLSEPQSAGYKF